MKYRFICNLCDYGCVLEVYVPIIHGMCTDVCIMGRDPEWQAIEDDADEVYL